MDNLNGSDFKIRPFIKWPGSKYKLIDFVLSKLPKAKTLVEPFVGSGAVFLNTDYEYYLLNDANFDLINLYKVLQKHGEEFIAFCKKFFILKNNTPIQYYKLRDQFNHIDNDNTVRASLFLYLNRHGYNGLCRFNKSNKFNVPFGRHKSMNFPEQSMRKFYLKSKRAKFLLKDFSEVLNLNMDVNTVIYCDPPYVPLSSTSNFVNYNSVGFDISNQEKLVKLATKLSSKGIPVLISNHYTNLTKKIYHSATEITTFKTRRMISCKPENRRQVTEILALYTNKISK